MHDTELVLLVVLAAVAACLVLALRLRVPYPIFLVVGGLAIGLIPGGPRVVLQPDLVLVVVLPPLLYAAAFFSSLQDLRANLRPISLLAVGLVLATTVTVALVARALMGFGWAEAFVLGAVVAPTDPVAATAIARRLRVPRRVVTILEGESLVNDATALVLYRVAIGAVVAGSFSALEGGGRFFAGAIGGVAIGLAIGWIVASLRRTIDHPPTEILVSLVTPYFAYLPAEALGASAVLAAVTTGIYLGWRSPELITPATRIQAFAFWESLVFVLNSMLFMLVGLQLPTVLDALGDISTGTLIGYAAAICGAVILTRIAWVFPLTYLPRALSRRLRERDPYPPWQLPAVISWAGMRGAVSLAAALAIPLHTDAGGSFPNRALIVFCAFAVILVTLVAQGLSLPMLIRRLGVESDGDDGALEEAQARLRAAEAAIERIDELASEGWVRDDSAERMRGAYEYRRRRFNARLDDGDDGALEDRSLAFQRLRREVLEAERAEIIRMRNRGLINDDIMRRVERDLDLEDARLEI